LACAAQALLEKGEAYTTAEFKVNLTRPITPRTGEVVCEGKVVHKGCTLAVSAPAASCWLSAPKHARSFRPPIWRRVEFSDRKFSGCLAAAFECQ
jgi:hypothetical protein